MMPELLCSSTIIVIGELDTSMKKPMMPQVMPRYAKALQSHRKDQVICE